MRGFGFCFGAKRAPHHDEYIETVRSAAMVLQRDTVFSAALGFVAFPTWFSDRDKSTVSGTLVSSLNAPLKSATEDGVFFGQRNATRLAVFVRSERAPRWSWPWRKVCVVLETFVPIQNV